MPPSCSTAADANRDGSLDRTEYAKLISTDRMFQTVEFGYYDANGDGKVERTEFVDKPNRAFALLDKNNQCKLTSDQTAGARAHTEQIFDSKKAELGDPREKKTPGMPLARSPYSLLDSVPAPPSLGHWRCLAFWTHPDPERRGTPDAAPALGAQ